MAHNSRWLAFILAATLLASLNAPAQILTPPAPPAPHINGPKVYGVRPGHPFLYRIPCTGTRPIRFSAKGLPHSLKLDPATGIIAGQAPAQKGEFSVTFQAVNSRGKSTRPFKIVVGETIGLTPQMGWNDWYTFYEHPTDDLVRRAAEAMISSGMADYGYQFVDIDGAWQRSPGLRDLKYGEPVRGKNGEILPTADFSDMAALTAYIHSFGLKAGIYTSPGPLTCDNREGSLHHEQIDARQYAAWGFDLLKHDMCSYEYLIKDKSPAEYIKPYEQMGAILKSLDRDLIFNLCQYGKADVWTWARRIGGNSWRTTEDVGMEAAHSLPGFYYVGISNAEHALYASPGGFNDPDYIIIGTAGNALDIEAPPKPTSLTPDEQYSYMSMWSLMAAPLIFSGDMSRLDPFTLNILCNSEVIDVDQDALGKQAAIIRKTPQEFILAKPLEDGSLAVGLFNLTEAPASISVSLNDLSRNGTQTVRDLWRQKDIATATLNYSATVRAHGVSLVCLIDLKR